MPWSLREVLGSRPGLRALARRAASVAWEAPQTSLGAANLALQLVQRNVAAIRRERGRIFVELRGVGAVSLGHFVFWGTVDSRFVRVNPSNKDHEYGHALQSRMLGPAYLLVVGVPSVMRVAYANVQWFVTRQPWEGYYAGFPESWADRLGGVVRPRCGANASST